MGRIYAGTLGMVAFVTMVARTFLYQGSAGSGMLYAAGAMFLFAGFGWIAGSIAESTVAEAVRIQFDKEVAAQEAAAAEK